MDGTMKGTTAGMDTIRKLILGLLVLAVVVKAAGMAWAVIEPPQAPTVVGNERPESAPVQRLNLTRLQEANLFGRAVVKPAEPKEQPKEIAKPQVKSRLAVKLLGIAKAAESDAAVAILLERNRQRAYSVGEQLEIDARATLAAIKSDRVVLDVAGETQYVELEPLNDTSGVMPVMPSLAELPQRISLDRPEVISLVGNDLVKFIGDSTAFGRYVQLRPNVVDGRLNGYRLLPGNDSRLLQALGLESGDLITHVAGIDITDPENTSRLAELARSERWLKVGIARGDSIKDIEVDLGAR